MSHPYITVKMACENYLLNIMKHDFKLAKKSDFELDIAIKRLIEENFSSLRSSFIVIILSFVFFLTLAEKIARSSLALHHSSIYSQMATKIKNLDTLCIFLL